MSKLISDNFLFLLFFRPIPNRGCPYLYYTQPTRPHTHQQHQPHPHTSHTRQHTHQPHPHTSHTRPLRHLPSSAFSPIAMNGTVALQHPPSVEGSAVLIDVDQMPDHVRSLPVTSLPNPLIVTSVPMATPTYVQPPAPQPMLRRVSKNCFGPVFLENCICFIENFLAVIFSRKHTYYRYIQNTPSKFSCQKLVYL